MEVPESQDCPGLSEEDLNITIQVLALGTGQALRAAQDGNVEIVLNRKFRFSGRIIVLLFYNLY